MDENILHRKGKVTTVEERAASEEETPELVEIDILYNMFVQDEY